MLRPAAKVLAGPQGDFLGAFCRYRFHDGPFAVAATVVRPSLKSEGKKRRRLWTAFRCLQTLGSLCSFSKSLGCGGLISKPGYSGDDMRRNFMQNVVIGVPRSLIWSLLWPGIRPWEVPGAPPLGNPRGSPLPPPPPHHSAIPKCGVCPVWG